MDQHINYRTECIRIASSQSHIDGSYTLLHPSILHMLVFQSLMVTQALGRLGDSNGVIPK